MSHFFALAILVSAFSGPTADDSITKWEPVIKGLEKRQATEETENGIVFYGSSSIRKWDSIKEDLLPWPAIQRGYGGAKLKDITHFAPRILGPHLGLDNPERCRAIVLFVANDITGNSNSDLSPKEVGRSFASLHSWIRSKDRTIPVFWIEVTPTASRWKAWDKISSATTIIRETIDRDPSAFFIPTAGAFLGDNGEPAAEYFVDDKLHLNPHGYELWASLIKTQLHLRLGAANVQNADLPVR